MADRFDRFTERARAVLVAAQQSAVRFNQSSIDPLNLLHGMLVLGGGPGVATLQSMLGNVGPLTRSVEAELTERSSRRAPNVSEIGLTPSGKKVIELSVVEARRFGHHYIGTEHILLGLVALGDPPLLQAYGVTLNKSRTAVAEVLEGTIHAATSTPQLNERAALKEALVSSRRAPSELDRMFRLD